MSQNTEQIRDQSEQEDGTEDAAFCNIRLSPLSHCLLWSPTFSCYLWKNCLLLLLKENQNYKNLLTKLNAASTQCEETNWEFDSEVQQRCLHHYTADVSYRRSGCADPESKCRKTAAFLDFDTSWCWVQNSGRVVDLNTAGSDVLTHHRLKPVSIDFQTG